MCRMLGVMCNDEDLLPCAIREVGEAIRVAKGDYDGYGIGYYSHDEPLLVRHPCERPCQIDYTEVIGDITSNVLLANVLGASETGWKDSNTQPFRFRKWLFAHVGQVPALVHNRAGIIERLPSFLSRDIQGETGSELFFHLFMDVLYKNGKLNDLSLTGDQLADQLKASVDIVDGFEPNKSRPDLAIIATNGQVMGAVCRGIPMHYSHREGILECQRHDDSEQQQHNHRRFRGILVGASMSGPGHQWREVGDGNLLSVSRELELRVRQL